jgi:solute carrier family 25 phosphate transporter 3
VLFELAPALKATVESQLCVSLLAGLAAGVASAIISQPADAILSEVNRRKMSAGGVGAAAAALWAADGGGGPRRFFAGLGSRCVWSGSIISGQFFVYDIAKALFGITRDDLQLFLDVQFKDMQL